MSKPRNVFTTAGLCALLLLAIAGKAAAATNAISAGLTPSAVLGTMEQVADWQLANPSKHKPTDWTVGAEYAGMMALAGISGDLKYLDAMVRMGESNQWHLGGRKYHADDHCVGQTYAEVYLRYRDQRMIAPMRERFDDILANPSPVQSLEFCKSNPKATDRWSWCDSLFMAPPAWIRLYAATGDTRYLDFAVTNWWQTSDYLYDKEEHLYFRDSTYFKKQEANGRKVFWSRGNGWVMGGLVRMLQLLPDTHPDRERFQRQFVDMAEKLLKCQQADGLWRASLLDPASYPLKETSGSGFYIYAFAWGVNQGLLDPDEFTPAVEKGWRALVGCVQPDGKLTHVQPIGADPKAFSEDATEAYGVGSFLLAGSEVYRMVVFRRAPSVFVKVTNPGDFRRENETIELDWSSLYASQLGGARAYRPPNQAAVMDGLSSRILDSQLIPSGIEGDTEKLLFQVDLGPKETRIYKVLLASGLAATPKPLVKTYARLVKERMNDMAWESDRTAHRMYQQALIKGEGTISSGIDVWSKATRALVIDKWYKRGHYHDYHDDGMDGYRVGKSCGCGGLGVWDGKQLFSAINFREGKVLLTGPIRSEFELDYDTWDAGGRKVSEKKRISIDAGSNFSRAQSIFTSEDPSPLGIGVGIAQRPIESVMAKDQAGGWAAYWQPPDGVKGNIACAIVLPGGVKEFVLDKTGLPAVTQAEIEKPSNEGLPASANLLAITQAEPGKPFVYYLGAGWSKSGDFPDARAWQDAVQAFAARLKAPVKVEVRAR